MFAPTRSLVLLIALALAFGAAERRAAAAAVVVTTNTILADMTREIAGDAADVRCLVPAGVDLHGFDPTPRDIAPLLEADLVVANGAGAEPWLERFLAASGYTGPTVQATDGCALLHAQAHEPGDDEAEHHDHAGQADPHAWHDPACARRYVANIRDALCRALPAQAVDIRRRAQLYSAQIETLDLWARRLFARVPVARKRIVTPHDSLAYFGRAYGLEILSLRGLDSRAEADARQVAAIVDALKTTRATAVFTEIVIDPRAMEQIVRDTGARLGGTLLTDSLAPEGSAGSTYLGMLRENTLRILAAIEPPGAEPPPATPPQP